MVFLPTVIRVEYRGGYMILLTFNDGVERTVDFAEWLEGPVLEPLKDVGYFQRFFLERGTITWPNGADIAPETLYESAKSSEAAQLGVAMVRLRRPLNALPLAHSLPSRDPEARGNRSNKGPCRHRGRLLFRLTQHAVSIEAHDVQ